MPDAIRIDADEGGANGGPVPLLVRGVRLVQKRTYRQFADVPHARHWRLRFLSRTSLTTGDKKSLLPLPESMLGGLGRKWNAFAAADRPTHPLYTPTGPLLEALTGNVMIMEIDTLSTTPNGPGMLASRGFVGTVTLSVTDDLPRAVFDAFCRLVYFARFAGIGERTTEGWGRVEVTAL